MPATVIGPKRTREQKSKQEREEHNARVTDGSAYRAWMKTWEKRFSHKWVVRDGRYYPST